MSVERRPVKGGPCEGCPGGGCVSCPTRTPAKEALVASVIKFSNFESLTRLKKLPAARIFFNTSGEILMRLKEKICSVCQKAASTCSHSKSKTSALAAA